MATAHPADPLIVHREVRQEAAHAACDTPVDTCAVVVPASGRFEGLLTFKGRARLEGEFKGEIVCQGSLHVAVGALVIGTIEVDELIVAGTLEGDATARERIRLEATARVRGVIRAPQVALEDGCVLDGRCETGETGSLA